MPNNSALEVGEFAPFDGMTITPDFFYHEAWDIIHGPAWYGLCVHLLSKKEVTDNFERDYSVRLNVLLCNTNTLDKLISDETGHTKSVLLAWFDWVTLNYWGEQE